MSQSDVSCTKTHWPGCCSQLEYNTQSSIFWLLGNHITNEEMYFEELMQKQCITDNFYKYMSVMISISQKETIIHLKPTVWTLLKNLGFLGLYLSDHRYVCGKKQSYSPLWSGEIWNRALYCQLNHTCIIFIPLCTQASLTFCVTGTGTLNDSSSAPMPLLASAATIPADAALLSFTK